MAIRKNAKFLSPAEQESFVKACVLMKAGIVNPGAPLDHRRPGAGGFFHGRAIESLPNTLAPFTSAIHAYDVSAALTYVEGGAILPHYQQ